MVKKYGFVFLFVLGQSMFGQLLNKGVFYIGVNSSIYIETDIINNEGGVITNNGKVLLDGDLLNDGVFKFTESSEEISPYVELLGIDVISVKGGGHISFYDLKLDVLNVVVEGLDIGIENVLDFNKGVLRVLEENSINFGVNASFINASNTSFVDGAVKVGATKVDFVFPLGAGGYYRPVAMTSNGSEISISNVKGNVTDIYSAESKQGGISIIDNNEYWIVKSESIDEDTKFSVSWDFDTTDSKLLEKKDSFGVNLKIARWDGKVWINEGGTLSDDEGSLSFSLTGEGYIALCLSAGILDKSNYNTGFTPNGDGVNDLFVLSELYSMYPNFEMEIFNRAGILLHKFKANPNEVPDWWNGKVTEGNSMLGGDVLPTGNYYYKLKYNPDDGKKDIVIRWVYLSN
ncbi:MAG: gliding motility-associated C-terminal domain-containing protein [Flavobacteriaceae bacterium]|nr:gliding motility-associated C-terminal domain-containing protein [Flavobacteriaceae bacterium]